MFDAARCYLHALAETKQPFNFPMLVTVGDGEPVPIALPLDDGQRQRLQELLSRGVRQLSAVRRPVAGAGTGGVPVQQPARAVSRLAAGVAGADRTALRPVHGVVSRADRGAGAPAGDGTMGAPGL